MPHKDQIQKNAYHRAYYRANKATINGRQTTINRERRHVRYAEIQTLKANPCTDCGKSFPYYVMDFDHRDPSLKTMDVASMVKRMFAWEFVLVEIAKCDLVCANCHRLRTYHGDNSYKTRLFRKHKAVLDELKSTTLCLDRGGLFASCQMDFDHVQSGSKTANIAQLVAKSEMTLATEIAKCHLVCANCHRVRGNVGVRPDAPEHSERLVARFREIASRTPLPDDGRLNGFPMPHLLGQMPDKELAALTGLSREMVAWHRRKAGIVLNRQGERAST